MTATRPTPPAAPRLEPHPVQRGRVGVGWCAADTDGRSAKIRPYVSVTLTRELSALVGEDEATEDAVRAVLAELASDGWRVSLRLTAELAELERVVPAAHTEAAQ